MRWNSWIRQGHRWVSMAFVVTVVAMAWGEPPKWIVFAPLLPLFFLIFSGLYMFAQPYAAKLRLAASR